MILLVLRGPIRQQKQRTATKLTRRGSRLLLQRASKEKLLERRPRELVDLRAVRRNLVRNEQRLHALRRIQLQHTGVREARGVVA